MPLPARTRTIAVSYSLFVGFLILIGVLHLSTAFLAALFSYLALTKMKLEKRKWIGIALFSMLLIGIFYGFYIFTKNAMRTLPEIAREAIPVIVKFAESRGIELPFTDVESLKAVALEGIRGTLSWFGNFAKIATKEFLSLIVGVVIAVGIFINPRLDQDRAQRPLTVFSLYAERFSELFASLYRSFETVIGAQVIISTINTFFTALYVYSTSLPHASTVVVLTFLCGLLPVIGNLISNTIIVGIAFTVSPQLAFWSLVFLITIHKLEYFLNSKIIGSRIRFPMWLTLTGIVLGERLLGVAGIILAPVVLNFIKREASKFTVDAPQNYGVAASKPVTIPEEEREKIKTLA